MEIDLPRFALALAAIVYFAATELLIAAERFSQPNVVLIISDDQGAGDYGFMGHPHIRTPNIDKLASQSLTFPRGMVATSVCCPSLATIITGLYPHQHKITANDPPLAPGIEKDSRGSSERLTMQWNAAMDDLPTLPRLLSRSGYMSFQTGKWWHGDFRRGGFTNGMTLGTRHGDAGLAIGREGLQPIYDFVENARKQEKPFFVWYAPFMPHAPHTPPDRLLSHYNDKTESQSIARYWAMCEWFDETCGQLLEYLDRENLANNTIVIYVTDNGWIQSPSSSKFAPRNKTTPFDAGHRTPIMIRWPGKVEPSSSQALASSVDIVPTLLTAVGTPIPDGLRGVNLLDNKAVSSRKVVFGECFTIRSQTLDDPAENVLWRWVTDGRWRLILPRTFQTVGRLKSIPSDSFLTPDLQATLRDALPMLYDLNSDPNELENVQATNPEIVLTLRSQLDAHWSPKVISPVP
jgi:arylsulfatase A-like enzyme